MDGFTHGGEGVARVDGKAVFVPGALPGERVAIRIVDDRARWARADLVDVLEPSPDRVEPPCPYATDCGGCDLQHATPVAQRRLKTRVVREQLTRLGGIPQPSVSPCRPVGPDIGYRTRAELHAAPDGRLGFHRTASHDVVPIDRCLVLTDPAHALREVVGDGTGASEVAVRAHASTGTAAVVITPGESALTVPDGDFDVLLVQPDGSLLPLRGDGVLAEEIAGITFRFDTTSFFQVNTGGAAAIIEEVLAACGDVVGALVWDLYAGVGLLSVPLAAAGAEVIAVDGHAAAAGYARANALAAGVDLDVLAEPVRHVVARTSAGGPDVDLPDVVVLDPPRTGAGKDVVRELAALAPAMIVYVACDVAALARDAHELTTAGYQLVGAVPLDLFPMTHHVEVVASFAR